METFTTTQSGDVDDGGTFGNDSPGVQGVDFPATGGGDIVNRANGHTLTIPSGYTAKFSCSLLDSTTGTHGKIIINGTWILDADSDWNDWNEIIINAGGVIDVDGNDLTYGHGSGDILWLTLNGTLGNPATIKSTTWGGKVYNSGGNVVGIYTDFDYGEIDGLDDSRFSSGSGLIELTSISYNNCVFSDHGNIDLLYGSRADQAYTIANCDFKEPHSHDKRIYISCSTTKSGSETREFKDCTFSSTTYRGQINMNAEDLEFSNIILKNYSFLNAEPNITHDGIFAYNPLQSSGTVFPAGSSGEKTDITNSYFYMDINNPKPIITPAGIKSFITDSIFETTNAANEGNLIVLGSGDCDVLRNIMVGEATLVSIISTRAGDYNIRRNTIFGTSISTSYGLLLGSESAAVFTGTVNVHSNIISDSSTGDNDIGVRLNTATADQINLIDNNCWWGFDSGDVYDRHYNVDITDKTEGVSTGFGGNDINSDPQFTDKTRTIASWDSSLGGGGTAANAITEMLKLNESGFDTDYTLTNLLTYIKTGFTPTNSALQNAGYTGEDIGAVAVSVEGLGSLATKIIMQNII